MNINSVTLTGRLVKAPGTKFFNEGKSITNFCIAVDDGFGEKKKSYFINCKAWNNTGEALANYADKGKRIAINGKIEVESWVNKEGKNQSKIIINAFIIEIIDFKEKQEGQQEQGSYQEPKNDVPVEENLMDTPPF